MKFRIPFHNDRISLRVKISVLLVTIVVVSLLLAGIVIYKAMRLNAYHQYADALTQIASGGAMVFDVKRVNLAGGEGPKANEARALVRGTLAHLWKKQHFDRGDRPGRLTLLRLDLVKRQVVPFVWLGEKPHLHNRDLSLVWDAATQQKTTENGIKALDEDWMVAWAPLFGTLDERNPVVLQAEYSSSIVNYQLIRNLGVILLACLLGLLFALAGSVVVAYQLTKPLRAFADVMTLMKEKDNFDIRIDLHPNDREMKIVEQTFIGLMKRVRDSREKVEKSYLSTLQALVTALDIRDNETSGHSLRVMHYSGIIADRMHLNEKQREEVERGALLHDIGKIGVPDSILRKSGKLTEDEWQEMKKHPEIGRKLLGKIDFLESAIPVVYCHHERWDGTGYPQGLQGQDIPLAARIFMVADALDTITSARYYKKASSFEAARKEIKQSAATQFDPGVVLAFMAIPVKNLRRIHTESVLQINHHALGSLPDDNSVLV